MLPDKKPEWKSGSDKANRLAISRFIIEALETELQQRTVEALKVIATTDLAKVDPAALRQFVRLISDSGFDEATRERIGQLLGVDLADLIEQVEKLHGLGFDVIGGELPKKRGVKSAFSDAFQSASDDVPRIRALFFQHWGHRNRTERPMAEDIAAERWGLSDDERTALIRKFQRKS